MEFFLLKHPSHVTSSDRLLVVLGLKIPPPPHTHTLPDRIHELTLFLTGTISRLTAQALNTLIFTYTTVTNTVIANIYNTSYIIASVSLWVFSKLNFKLIEL